MKVQYIGMFDEVEVPYIEDGIHKSLAFKRGAAVECPDELAVGLLEQVDNYRAEGKEERGTRKEERVESSAVAGGDS